MNVIAQLLPCLVMALVCLSGSYSIAQEESDAVTDEPSQVFSGPQIGESVPGFEMDRVFGEAPDGVIDVVKTAAGKPLVIVFFHEKTRPAFGLMRALANFAETRKKSGLTTAVCFLTKDPSETKQWVNQVTRLLPKHVVYGIYSKGIEGPGAYGLNRNVALTVLVANEGKVVHNSALVQPSLDTDGSKILKSIVEITGGGEVPAITKFSGQNRMARSNPGAEPNMRPWLAPVIRKGATNEEVDKAAEALESHCKTDSAARKAVGRIANTVVQSGKLENYGTLQAQDYLKKWANEFGSKAKKPKISQDKNKMSDQKAADSSDDKK